jgi:hypothetical protein
MTLASVPLFAIILSNISSVEMAQEQSVAVPPLNSCTEVVFAHATLPRWPLPLYLCHHDAAEFNKLKEVRVLESSWLPAKSNYQGLADSILDSRIASMALAQGRRWYSQMADDTQITAPVLQLVELTSPYFGCTIEITAEGFIDPCTSAQWDKLGRLKSAVAGLPNESLRLFPFARTKQKVLLGEADETLNWQYQSFKPNLQDASVPLLDRVGKGLFWGMLSDVKALWPEVEAKGTLTETEQSQLFILAVSKQQAEAVTWLVEQGLNPAATNEFGDNALSVARMIESADMQQLLMPLIEAQTKRRSTTGQVHGI